MEDALARPFVHLLRGMSGDGDLARLDGMLELPMAAALCHLIPSFVLHETQNISRLHSLASSLSQCQSADSTMATTTTPSSRLRLSVMA